MAAFFLSLLPQFTSGDTTVAPLLVLGLVFSIMTLAWLSAYAFAVARAGDSLRRGAVRRILDAAVGAVLVALGIRVAVDRRAWLYRALSPLQATSQRNVICLSSRPLQEVTSRTLAGPRDLRRRRGCDGGSCRRSDVARRRR